MSPYERLVQNEIDEQVKRQLAKHFRSLDPVLLLSEIESLQEQFWRTAVKHSKESSSMSPTALPVTLPAVVAANAVIRKRPILKPRSEKPLVCIYQGKKSDLDEVWADVCVLLDDNPTLTPREIEKYLFEAHPGRFGATQFNTIRRKVLEWRNENGFSFEYQKAKPRRKSNIDFTWAQALPVLEAEPHLSRRRLHTLMMEKLPGQVRETQLSALASRLKTWKANRYSQITSGTSELMITLFESDEPLPVVPEFPIQ